MKRRWIAAVSGLFFLAAMLVALPTLTNAQSTPVAATVGVQALGTIEPSGEPGKFLLLQERTFPAGSDSGQHAAPGPVVLSVKSGEVTFTVIQGAALVTRAGSTQTESVSSGQSTQLSAGDTVTYDAGVIHDVTNNGTESAVTIEARLNPVPTATPVP